MSTKKLEVELIKKLARLKKNEKLDDKYQTLYDLHGKQLHKYPRLRINVNQRNDQWSIDLAEMNDLTNYNSKIKYWLVCIDIFSRYAWVKMLTNKKSEKVAKAFEEIISESAGAPKKIQSDQGTEFQMIRKGLSKKYGFTVFHTHNREIKATHAERFIGTLKTMVRRVLTGLNRKRYTNLLPIIVERYNHLPHLALYGETPHKMYYSKKRKEKYEFLKDLANPLLIKTLLKKGQRVRVSRIRNSPFEKASLRQWVNEIFIIKKVFITDPPTYSLVDKDGETITGIFYREELKPV